MGVQASKSERHDLMALGPFAQSLFGILCLSRLDGVMR
jgi:hypothetical protein